MENKFILLSYAAILLLPTIVFSQKTFVSIGANLALPAHYQQSFNDRGTGFGGVMRVESPFSPHLSGIASVGYLSFAKASPFSDGSSYQLSAISIQFGVKYYISRRKIGPDGFFLSGELGIMSTTNHITYTNSEQKVKESDLIVAPGVGYQLKNFELSFRLQYDLTKVGYHVYYYKFGIAYAFLRRSK